MTRTGRGGDDEVAHQFDLVGKGDVEQVTGPLLGGRHGFNLGARSGPRGGKAPSKMDIRSWYKVCPGTVAPAMRRGRVTRPSSRRGSHDRPDGEVASGRERLSAQGRS
ncbi:hypothetical protein GCM10009721_27500 [Terrabacter tumescens]|uniref:Uncharacterized protein n=1 Tax=Terrabacter tumescens TaxID=60443 RepID=A0ABQ2I5P0_9MICO|nr:hypothetical protein GCM10009721_27500 [Terrabacter tumescens]